MRSPDYYTWEGDTLVFNIFLQPRASRKSLVGLHDNAIKIALTAPPVDGKANKQLIYFLSQLFLASKKLILTSLVVSTVGVNASACASHHSSQQIFLNNHLYF